MMAFIRLVKAPLILERAKQQDEKDGFFLIPAPAGGLDYWSSQILLPACIFNNFIKLLAAANGGLCWLRRRITLSAVAGLKPKEEQNANSPYLDWKESGSQTIECRVLVGVGHHRLLSTCAYREKCFRYLNRSSRETGSRICRGFQYP